MAESTIQQLANFGQSVWLDYISRPLIETGELKDLIQKGLRGQTSNPSIFNNAIGSSEDYDEKIIELKQTGSSTFEIYDALTIRDIQDAADCFAPVYRDTNKLDGYVSLEINPLLAHKVAEQIKEGLRLFRAVRRPNLMIKVPSTSQGFLVIEELIANGVNVNVTLIFSQKQYVQTVDAYYRGLKRLAAAGGNLADVHSVASVFISRIDTSIDAMLDEIIADLSDQSRADALKDLKGKAAVANSHIIYDAYKNFFDGASFEPLRKQGANVQRVLWGSTSTKNPAYSDIKYVTELIAAPTVNTLPEKTLKAFLDHGEVKPAFEYSVQESQTILDKLLEAGINIDHVCYDLLHDGCVAFDDAFTALLTTIEKKAAQLVAKS